MSRDWRLLLDDMLEACRKIESFAETASQDQFFGDEMRYDAVLRNLEVLGEAAKRVPDAIKAQMEEIDWRKVMALRDVIAHDYFGLDRDILWDVIRSKIPETRGSIARFREEKG